MVYLVILGAQVVISGCWTGYASSEVGMQLGERVVFFGCTPSSDHIQAPEALSPEYKAESNEFLSGVRRIVEKLGPFSPAILGTASDWLNGGKEEMEKGARPAAQHVDQGNYSLPELGTWGIFGFVQ